MTRSKDEMTRLEQNTVNLAGQVLAGEFEQQHEHDDGEQRLRDQVMRLWRDVDFDMPEGKSVELVTGKESKPKAKAKEEDSGKGTDTALENLPVFQEGCEEANRHAVYSRRGEPCESCGGVRKAD